MKLNIIKALVPAAAFLLAASVTSCMKDLEKGNIDPHSEQQVDINALYSKCYAGLIMEGNDGNADFTINDAGRSTLLRNLFNFNVLSTDESICWWSDGGIVDICYNQCVPSTLTLQYLYYRLVSNISYCNWYIGLSEAQADKTMLAEVRFIRAYNYYLMLDFFGDPAFATTVSPEVPMQAHKYNSNYVEGENYTRAKLLSMGREFLFNWVKDELLAAETDMLAPKAKKDTDADYGRADQAAAWFLLSRLYLNAGTYLNNDGQDNPYWDKALEYAEKVINSDYSLFTEDQMTAKAKNNDFMPYDLLFMGDNGSNGASCEAVLPLLQDGKITKGWGGSMFFIAAMWNPGMESVTGLTAGTTAIDWKGMRVRPQFLQKFISDPTVFEGKTSEQIRAYLAKNVDTRDDRALFWGKDHTVDLGHNATFEEGLAVTKWNNNYSNGETPHDTYDVDIDFFLFRAAEMYLNAAEAAMHLNNPSKAKIYMDAIRNRAHKKTKITDYTLTEILDERAREFYFEGQRRTDLIRYNLYGGQDGYNWDYKNGIKDGSERIKFDKTRNVFPIPSDEMQANKTLIQIDGYSND